MSLTSHWDVGCPGCDLREGGSLLQKGEGLSCELSAVNTPSCCGNEHPHPEGEICVMCHSTVPPPPIVVEAGRPSSSV